MPEDVFVYLGQCLRDAREECGLTQQELADQTGRGLRHLQDIEKGRKNPSYDVLASFIKRLGISANELFYPDASEQEKQVQHFMGKFLACTEDEYSARDCAPQPLKLSIHSGGIEHPCRCR